MTSPDRPLPRALAAARDGTLPAWAVGLVIAVPFLGAITALRGLTVALPIFHSSDEFVYHYPTILRFSHQLPFPHLGRYDAAQTPLFHIVMAYVGKLTGYELWRLRLVEALISYGLGLIVYQLLRRRLTLEQPAALALTVLFVLSPYVFGSSFRVITDNLATLLIVLALERLERFRETRSLAVFGAACAAVGAAMLTRQSAAFMVGAAALYGLVVPLPLARRAAAAAELALACVPVGLLFLAWHGLVPPGGDPSSCGLCSGHGGAGLVAQTPELALATIGLYGAVLFAPVLAARIHRAYTHPAQVDELLAQLRLPLAGAVAGMALLLAFPARPGVDAAGLVWSVASHFPVLDGSSLVFWVLVPLAGAVLGWRVPRAPRSWVVTAFAVCFILGALATRYPWQKYVDPFALLTVMLTVRRSELVSPRALAGAAVLATGFLIYAADGSSHDNVAKGISPTMAAGLTAPARPAAPARV